MSIIVHHTINQLRCGLKFLEQALSIVAVSRFDLHLQSAAANWAPTISAACRLGPTVLADWNHDIFYWQRRTKFCMSCGASCYHSKKKKTCRITLLMFPNKKNYHPTFPSLCHLHPFQSILLKNPRTINCLCPDLLTVNAMWISFSFGSTCFGSRFVCSRLFATGAGPQAAQEAHLVTKVCLKDRRSASREVSHRFTRDVQNRMAFKTGILNSENTFLEWSRQLTFYLTYILTFYLTFSLAFYVTFYLAFYLTYLSWHTSWHSI